MKIIRLAIVGFGNVGQGFVQILKHHRERLSKQFDLGFKVVAVNDLRFGSLYHSDGLPLDALLTAAASGDFRHFLADTKELTVEEMIEHTKADVLVEASFTNLETGEPALSYIRRALKRGMHVVTTNKGPIARCLKELLDLAHSNNVLIGYEGTVMSGTPALALGRKFLLGADITRIRGILNGTTNFILTRMQHGVDFPEALAEAQRLGYAEADPTGDIEGLDIAGKLMILSQALWGIALNLEEIERQGIAHLTLEDIRRAQSEGKCWKLIGTLEKYEDQVKASVRPTKIPFTDPLAAVSGATNAITYTTSLLGDITLIGPGAGRSETGYALLNDLLAIYTKQPASAAP
jgi:homoserine dehydrogenase